MINIEEAKQIADKHVEELNLKNDLNSHLSFICGESIKTENGYYFDYKIKWTSDKRIGLGGAPGFLVSNEGIVEAVSWEQKRGLNI